MVRRIWLVLALALLLLSLLGNVVLWRGYVDAAIQLQALQSEVDSSKNDIQDLQSKQETLLQQIETLQQEKAQLEQQLNSSSIQDDMLEVLDRLEAETRAMRGLVPDQPVERQVISREELRSYLEKMWDKEYPPRQAATDAQVLSMLELLAPGTDLHTLMLDLYTEQVMGFYDLDQQKLYVIAGQEFGPLEKLTFVHEYIHALQDQSFELGDQIDAVKDDADRSRALESLTEGDATMGMQQYLTDRLAELYSAGLMSQTAAIKTPLLNAAPPFVQRDLLFPYENGLLFAMALYDEDEWGAIDQAWANPPQSTEQILHPERYPDDVPALVEIKALTATLGAGWHMQGEDTLGEFVLRQHLLVRLERDEVDTAATGWGGDHYVLYTRPDTGETCLVLRFTWDSSDDADEFVAAYRHYAETRYNSPSEGTPEEGMWWSGQPGLYLAQDGEEVLLVLTTYQAVAEKVAQVLR